MSISLSSSFSSSYSSSFPGSFSRAVTPQLDRRAHADRRTPLKPMPLVERSWTQSIVLAGCVGALLGCSAAFAVLTRQQVATGESALASVKWAPAAAVMAPLFDTAPFIASVPTASLSLPIADKAAPTPGSESYSEDAAGVPSATYHEPPTPPTATVADTALAAKRRP